MWNWLANWSWVEMAAFSGVGGLTLTLLYYLTNQDPRLKRRLHDLRGWLGGAEQPSAGGDPAQPTLAFASRCDALFFRANRVERVKLYDRLIKAGVEHPSGPSIFVAARLTLAAAPVMAGLAAGISGAVVIPQGLLWGAIAGGFGMLLPGFWLDRRKLKRRLALSRSLPDFLDLLVTCLESGLSLDASLRRVTAELQVAHPILAAEMARVQNEMDLGATTDAALRNLGERCEMESISALAAFIQQTRRFGVGVAEALRAHAETLREQREQRAEELAQKAAVKILFPTLLLIFPAVFVVLAGPAAIKLNERFSQSSPQAAAAATP